LNWQTNIWKFEIYITKNFHINFLSTLVICFHNEHKILPKNSLLLTFNGLSNALISYGDNILTVLQNVSFQLAVHMTVVRGSLLMTMVCHSKIGDLLSRKWTGLLHKLLYPQHRFKIVLRAKHWHNFTSNKGFLYWANVSNKFLTTNYLINKLKNLLHNLHAKTISHHACVYTISTESK
jgi:hypothetical protein